MKDVLIALAVIAALVLGFMSWFFYVKATDAELALARNEAEQATGPCGSDFVAAVKNGNVVETYVAGNRVSPGMVANFFQEQAANGDTAIYLKSGNGKELIMVRPKR